MQKPARQKTPVLTCALRTRAGFCKDAGFCNKAHSEQMIVFEKSDGVATIRFNRPEIRSPLSADVLKELLEIVDEVAKDSSISRIIFTGTGDVFASGADLREIAELNGKNAADFARFGQSLMTKISNLPQRTIAAINGFCFGGALDLALACDVRIAARTASFAHPGTGLGIITGWGGTQRLPRLIGQAKALEMFFTATPIDADEALRTGLVDQLSDDALEAAMKCAQRD